MLQFLQLFFAEGGSGGGADPKKEGPKKDDPDPDDDDPEKDDPEPDDDGGEKTYTEEELQKIADKRVSEAVKTREKKLRKELEEQIKQEREDAERRAELSAEERAEEERKQREQEIAEREAKLKHKELLADTKDHLHEKGIPVKFADMLVGTDEDATKERISAFKKEWETALDEAVNERLKQKPPKQGGRKSGNKMTQEEFNKLGYRDRVKLKKQDPELYDELIKNA